ncbi:MAG: cache domain-containing protein [Bacteroidales bacterium]|nr:cache domain-containing protein [Bacteroidales bacterium]
MLNKLTLAVKMNILIAAFIITNVVFFIFMVSGQMKLGTTAIDTTTSLIDSTEQVKIKIAVKNMAEILTNDFKKVNKDSVEEVYQFFDEKLGNLRFEEDKSGYFFIYKGSIALLVPVNRTLENKDLGHLRDVNGVNYIRDLRLQAQKGGGFVKYIFQKPGKGEIDKVSYAAPVGDGDYWIGSGVYLDNVDKAKDITEVALSDEAGVILFNTLIPISILVLVLILLSINIRISIIRPIKGIITSTDRVAVGELNEIEEKNNDEITKITSSLNNLIKRLIKTSVFAKNIGEGNFDSEFEAASEKDVLGHSLINMRQSLIEAREAEEKRVEDEKVRIWTMNGHTVVNDILRENQHKIDILADTLLQKIIEYVDLNQGGIFLVNQEDENKLNLVASYAYDRKKFLDKTIELGEGLVGTCAIEQKTIYMTDIPDNYIHIGSGLGDAKPSSLIIVPLIINEKFYGVIELASFRKLKEHEVAFIEKTAENIASTISVAQITINTANLLEQHKMQSEELSAQEEEMRQNMEELQATQEESARRERDLTEKVQELEQKLADKEQ